MVDEQRSTGGTGIGKDGRWGNDVFGHAEAGEWSHCCAHFIDEMIDGVNKVVSK